MSAQEIYDRIGRSSPKREQLSPQALPFFQRHDAKPEPDQSLISEQLHLRVGAPLIFLAAKIAAVKVAEELAYAVMNTE